MNFKIDKEMLIEIQYGDEFTTQVEDGESDPYVGMRILAQDSYIYGSDNRVPKNWVTYLLNSLLESISDVVNTEKAVITNQNGPSYFVIEPLNETEVSIANVLTYDGIDDQEERLPTTDSVTISTEAYITEIIRASKELYKRIVSANPNLTDSRNIKLLEGNLSQAKDTLESK
ncbi:hypothetical protein ACFQJ7_08710 [Halovenus rubra]|uniref:Uncharacterized protein n=2 Tax=Halovenus rubra TaxID=869890 RepID=A0ABD5X6K3_9EURY|nr:hypothetical protein [Halovenus rubra]